MALHIATDRAFRTPAELPALVAAIVDADTSTQETHWLEWKGPLPIGKAEGQFAIAKAILGFANRQPSRAAAICEGTAYMVVGAEPQSAPGITVVDNAALGQGIDRYVHGPRWVAHYVDHAGVQVLVVVIEAPHPGDKIHSLQKAYDRFDAGTIFHRSTAHTEPAGPKLIEMLGERLLQGVREPDLALELDAKASAPLKRLYVTEDSVQRWLDDREAYVRANSGEKPKQPSTPPTAAVPEWQPHLNLRASLGDLWEPSRWAKPGDKEKFEERVKAHLAECRARLVENVFRRIVRGEQNVVTLSVANETDDPIAEVQVTVRVPRLGLRVYSRAPSPKPMPDLPEWPDELAVRLGPSRVAAVAVARPEDYIPAGSRPLSVADRDDCFEITWKVGNLLADTSLTRDVYIVCGMGAPEEIEAEVSARSTSHRGVARVTSTLTVSSENPWQLADWRSPTPGQG